MKSHQRLKTNLLFIESGFSVDQSNDDSYSNRTLHNW